MDDNGKRTYYFIPVTPSIGSGLAPGLFEVYLRVPLHPCNCVMTKCYGSGPFELWSWPYTDWQLQCGDMCCAMMRICGLRGLCSCTAMRAVRAGAPMGLWAVRAARGAVSVVGLWDCAALGRHLGRCEFHTQPHSYMFRVCAMLSMEGFSSAVGSLACPPPPFLQDTLPIANVAFGLKLFRCYRW